jgi:YggT family protein
MQPEILAGIGTVLNHILNMLQILIILSVVASLLGSDPNNQIFRIINSVTEPIYRPIRRLTRNIPGPFDWAPFAVMLIIVFLQKAFVHPMMRASM